MIRPLSDELIGHIAAGEVVERPAQVIKELIENSIDAGSSRIEVRIEGGGFQSIDVVDDGEGIPAGELPLALTRHATSKLRTIGDLGSIETKGFRGEALASIGMVSDLMLSSRTSDASGHRLSMRHGRQGIVEPAGMAPGTHLYVRSLFSNVPARKAFQARPSTEVSRIVDVVVAQAMAHFGIGFRLISDGRNLLDAPRTSKVEERLHDLLGDISDRLVELVLPETDDEAPGDEQWSGWISIPEVNRARADEIHILVNDRPVAAQPFLTAIRRGYRTRLMVGRSPIAVLNLQLPPGDVDVNVHPTKREVRLRNAWRVLERLERAISHTLESHPTRTVAFDEILSGVENQARLPFSSPKDPVLMPPWAKVAEQRLASDQDAVARGDVPPPVMPAPSRVTPPSPVVSSFVGEQTTLPGAPTRVMSPALSAEERDLERQGRLERKPLVHDLEVMPELEPIGQFSQTYILAQSDDSFYIIDQHAAHERIRFERLREDGHSWSPQMLIDPIPLTLTAAEKASIEQVGDILEECGYLIFVDEQETILKAVPEPILGDDAVPLLRDLIRDLSSDEGRPDAIERERDRLAFLSACRKAIKANDELDPASQRRLLHDLRTIPNPWACVHGRPTVMRITIDDLDRHFGRHG